MSEPVKKSLIKPHFVNISGSGNALNGLIAERNIEQPKEEYRDLNIEPNKHIIVLHSNKQNNLEWKIDGKSKKQQFYNGDLIINPAGLNVSPKWSSDVELLVLAIKPKFVELISEEMNCPNSVGLFPQFKFQDKLINLLMKNMIKEFENEPKPDLVYTESLAYTLVAHIIRNYSRNGKHKFPIKNNGLPSNKLSHTIEFINDNISKNLSLEDIAIVAGFSPSYFILLFKNATGLTPHQYIIKRKVENAKRDLIQTQKSITEIALDAGFSDQSHLTRVMRKYTGFTPGDLRRD